MGKKEKAIAIGGRFAVTFILVFFILLILGMLAGYIKGLGKLYAGMGLAERSPKDPNKYIVNTKYWMITFAFLILTMIIVVPGAIWEQAGMKTKS